MKVYDVPTTCQVSDCAKPPTKFHTEDGDTIFFCEKHSQQLLNEEEID